MAEPIITPVIPNLSLQAEAVAGSSSAIFTATDRQIIQELAGEIRRDRSFKEVFFSKELTPKVENEQSTVRPGQDAVVKAIESRQKEHRRMLKYSLM
ncbi:hypothetical protein HZB08_01110, partial [Candidatus Saganbacteria bacterium]|nr:hypothetical protein [Candidatus Saganbacteria bacterium]